MVAGRLNIHRGEVIARLFGIQLENDLELNGDGDTDPRQTMAVVSNALLDLTLDLLGMPEDSVSEQETLQELGETGELPGGAFCREWMYILWEESVLSGEMSVAQFIETVTSGGIENR